MTPADDQIEAMWRGELCLAMNIGALGRVLSAEQIETIKELIVLLHDLRMVKVQRVAQRRRQRAKKRAATRQVSLAD